MDALVRIPDKEIKEYQNIVESHKDDPTITFIEKVEALERFGISLLYKGYYKKAVDTLLSSLEISKSKNIDGTIALPSFDNTRSFIRISIYLAAAYYRLANLKNAEKYLKPLLKIKTNQDLIAISLSNLALVLLQVEKVKEATDRAKEGVAIAEKLYKLDSDQYLYHVRVLIMLYLKSEDFVRANALIDDSLFPIKEKKVLLAGCKFASGKMEEAYKIVQNAINDIKEEEKDDKISLNNDKDKESDFKHEKTDFKSEKTDFKSEKTDFKYEEKEQDNNNDDDEKKIEEKVDYDSKADLKGDNTDENFDKKKDKEKINDNIKKWTDYVLNAITKYNYAALQGRRFEYGTKRLEFLNDAATDLDLYKTKRLEIETSIMENDPFIMGHPDDKPHSLSFDYVVAPSAILSQVMISKIENFIMSSQYLEGLKIQAGLVIGNDDVDNWKSSEISKLIKEAVDSMKHIRKDFNSEAKNEGDIVIKHKALFDVEASIHAIENYRVLCDLAVGNPNGNSIDPELQQLAVTLTEKINKTFDINLNSNTAMKEKADVEEDKEKDKDKEGKKKGRGASRGEKKSLDYNSAKHDLATVRSELMPLISRFGRSDIALWVQWGLCESGGVGYGLFGQVSASTSDEGILVSKSNMKDPDPKTYDSFLKEVRARLLDVENDIDKRIISDRDYRSGEKEERILLNAALAKVAAQLGNKDQVSKHVTDMENLAMSLNLVNTRTLQNNDTHYIALAKRYRLDYEEWDTPPFLLPDKLLQRLMDLLQIAKDYLNAAETCCDWNLRKDAYKRIINIYCDIRNIPQAPNEEPIVYESIEKLKYFSDDDINNKETTSPSWTRQYSKARAQIFMSKLKLLSNSVREESKNRTKINTNIVNEQNNNNNNDNDNNNLYNNING